ncbi:hypothetical protein E2C01_045072 [Portunus trituberculatus]|uniref:Uncharacterized protein n=1 Tax=Portunus trituberculatus TaxID=210409 RepID=A0A5B7G256_PORTR|nr:hypothetical protein [Portunus trituberculatus]
MVLARFLPPPLEGHITWGGHVRPCLSLSKPRCSHIGRLHASSLQDVQEWKGEDCRGWNIIHLLQNESALFCFSAKYYAVLHERTYADLHYRCPAQPNGGERRQENVFSTLASSRPLVWAAGPGRVKRDRRKGWQPWLKQQLQREVGETGGE